jgi:hypothetical protein
MPTDINIPPCPELTLEFVKEEFAQWRLHRHHREKIPDPLWNYIHQLTKHYKINQITRGLGLNRYDMIDQLNKKFPTSFQNPSLDFINVPLQGVESLSPLTQQETAFAAASEQAACPVSPSLIMLEVKRTDGTIFIFHHLGSDHITSMMNQLVGR